MYCRTCGKEVNEKAIACPGCGVPPFTGDQFCYSCGVETNPAAAVCVKCGVALAGKKAIAAAGDDAIVASDPPKDPVLMALLSCCLLGLGQIILGQTAKGASILGGSIILGLLTAGFSGLVTVPLATIDAYKIAKKLKEGKSVKKWEWL